MSRSDSGVTVVGVGTVSTPADRVRLSIAVEQHASAAAIALSDSAASARSIRAGLRDAGVADHLVQTVGLSVDARWNNDQEVTGYSARQRFSVVAEDVEHAGELLERLGRIAGDAFRVDNVEVFADDSAPARRQAQADAFTDARAQAEAIAQQAGRALGEVRSITPTDVGAGGGIYARPMFARAENDSFAPGEVSVTERVQVSWDWATESP